MGNGGGQETPEVQVDGGTCFLSASELAWGARVSMEGAGGRKKKKKRETSS